MEFQGHASPALERIAAIRKVALALIIALATIAAISRPARAQMMVRLAGNHPRDIDRFTVVGAADSRRTLAMALTLKLRNRAALDQLIAAQEAPGSPNYHRWLTPDEFAARFGPTASDLQTAADWLSAQGFAVTSADLTRRTIAFTGTVAQAARAFNVAILQVADAGHYGNADDPELPASVASVIESVRGLDNLHAARPALRRSELRPAATDSGALQVAADTGDALVAGGMLPENPAPEYYVRNLGTFFGPADFQTFYDESPLLGAGLKGAGAAGCIGIVGDSDFVARPVAAFNSRFRLPGAGIRKVMADRKSPGINGDEMETFLDLEWAHAAAPGSPLRYYLGNNAIAAASDGLLDAIRAAVIDNACPVVSISYSYCGNPPSFYTATLDPIFAQAASQGQTVIASSGDQGAAGVVYDPVNNQCIAATSPTVSELAADPNVTAVGGVSFDPVYDGNGNDVGSVAERVWNDPDDGIAGGGASGGGRSAAFAKPSYQSADTPADGVRDVPDLSLIASPYYPGAITVMDGSCVFASAGCDGRGAVAIVIAGGTSLAAPGWAGIARLIVQAAGGRIGRLNPTLYDLAAAGQSAVGLRDVVSGNNGYNGVAGFDAGPGFDLATGWGTVDAAVFVPAYARTLPRPPTLKVTPAAIAFNNVAVGKPSPPRIVTISNPRTQKGWVMVGQVTAGGDFSAAGNCAGAMIGPGKSCKFTVRFTPTVSGPAAPVTLQIADDAGDSPQTVALTGSGRAPR